MNHETNVRFLKSAIALGELERAEAKRCLKVLKAESEGDAGQIAERLGLLSASGRLRVQMRLDARLKRKKARSASSAERAALKKKRGKKKKKRSRSSAERAALKRGRRGFDGDSASDAVGLDSDVLLDSSSTDSASLRDSESDEAKATQLTPVAEAQLPTKAVAGVGEAKAKLQPQPQPVAASDSVASEGPERREPARLKSVWLSPKVLGLFALAAVSGTLTGVAAVALGGVGRAAEVAAAPEADAEEVLAEPSPRSDDDAIDLSEEDGLGPDAIPDAPPGMSSAVRRPKTPAAAAKPEPEKVARKEGVKKEGVEKEGVKQRPERTTPTPEAEAPAPAPAPEKTRARKVKKEAPKVNPQTLLLWAVFQAFDREKTGTVRALEGRLAQLGADLPETHAASGFRHFLEGAYADAIRELTVAKPVTGSRGRLALARAYMFAGEHARALDQLGPEERASPVGRRIVKIVDGPFRAKYPNAAEALEATTPDGHYRVVTDLGLTRASLSELEAKLAGADPKTKRRLIAKVKKKHQGLREVCDTMDKAFKAYDKLFNIERKGDVVPTVYVFSQRGLFDGYSKELEVGSTEHTLGYYVPYYRVLVFYDRSKPGVKKKPGQRLLSQATLEVLLHETFHQWLHLYTSAPRWFDEGLAEYFGIAEMTRKELHYGLLPKEYPSRLSNIRDALRGVIARPLPLEELIQADRAKFYGENKAVNYAHAWSFVHFLGQSKKGKSFLRAYFKALREGNSLPQAYEAVFGETDMIKLERQWEAYVFSLK